MDPTQPQYEIIRHRSFQDDLVAIIDYLTENASYKIALQLEEEIQSQLDLISILPKMYPVYEPQPRLRKMPIHNWQYVIFYTIIEKNHQVILTRIFHTSRNIQALIQKRR